MISKKHKKGCKNLAYIEDLLILDSTVTGCISISAFDSLFGIPVGITSSAVRLIAVIKKYKSIIKKNKKQHYKIVLLAKAKLNSVEVSISKDLIDPNISHDEFVSVNNVQKEYDNMKEEIKNSNNK